MNKHTEVEVAELPICDLCKSNLEEKLAEYDSKLKNGVWANVCEYHFKKFGTGLGLGNGQKLILKK